MHISHARSGLQTAILARCKENVLEVAVKQLSCCPSCLSEFLQAHTTQMFPIDIKLLERQGATQGGGSLNLLPYLANYAAPMLPKSLKCIMELKAKAKAYPLNSDSLCSLGKRLSQFRKRQKKIPSFYHFERNVKSERQKKALLEKRKITLKGWNRKGLNSMAFSSILSYLPSSCQKGCEPALPLSPTEAFRPWHSQ
ncbi:hypothetical protein DV515_00002381, partial [Chloebia gouldiae]